MYAGIVICFVILQLTCCFVTDQRSSSWSDVCCSRVIDVLVVKDILDYMQGMDPLDSDVPEQETVPSTSIILTDSPEPLSTDTVAPITESRGIERRDDSATGRHIPSSYVELVETTKNGQIIPLEVKHFKHTVSDKFKHFARTAMHLRSPWLVPVLEISDESVKLFSLTTPHMTGGSLETRLRRLRQQSDVHLDSDYPAWMVTTAYQISAGIRFLHKRMIVHGSVCAGNVLFDQRGVVKLADYGVSTYEKAELSIRSRPSEDVYSFAQTVLQLLRPLDCEEELVSVRSLKQKLQHSAPETLLNQWSSRPYFDPDIWSADDITSQIFTKVVCECCRKRRKYWKTFNELTENLKALMKLFEHEPAFPLTPSVGPDQVCLYCSMEIVHSELLLRRTECPETCPYLKACASCMIKFGSHFHVESDFSADNCGDSSNSDYVEHVCDVHDCIIEPVIGGSRSFAMILHDASDDYIVHFTKNDFVNILQLATHPNIMRMPFENVHGIPIPSPMNMISCQSVRDKMEQIYRGCPSYFLFYYSGHELVDTDNKNKPHSQYIELVETLREFINKIAERCPRILMIFDCCYSSAVADLLRISLSDDSHVEWHVEWMSCSKTQESDLLENCHVSAFTKLLVSALKGGTEQPCPHGTAECGPCLTFRQSCSKKGYVSLHDIKKFVHIHMHSRQPKTQAGVHDVQIPLMRSFGNNCEPAISFFNQESTLYSFYFESKDDNTPSAHRFVTDDLRVANIWNMTTKHHQNENEACSLQFYVRYSMELIVDDVFVDSTMPYYKLKRVLETVSKDNECLLVKIDSTPKSIESTDSSDSPDTQGD